MSDDHLGKPFRRSELRAKMAHWLHGHAEGCPAPAFAALPAGADATGAIDRAALLKQLQIGGRTRPALVAKVIGLFLAETPALLEELAQGLAGSDQKCTVRVAHTLKSSSASVGAVALSELAGIAEGHARSGLLDAVRQCVAELNQKFDAAVRQLVAVREELLQSREESGAS